jgi:hypothetical protein
MMIGIRILLIGVLIRFNGLWMVLWDEPRRGLVLGIQHPDCIIIRRHRRGCNYRFGLVELQVRLPGRLRGLEDLLIGLVLIFNSRGIITCKFPRWKSIVIILHLVCLDQAVYHTFTTLILHLSSTIPLNVPLLPIILTTVSDKGTTLKSQLGTGTNTTAAPSGTASATAVSNPNVGNAGGGSADGNRGGSGGSGSSGSASTTGDSGTSFSQGGGSSSSEASNFRGYSRIVASWSAVMGLVVGGIFVLL